MSGLYGRISGTILWIALPLLFLAGCGDETSPPPSYNGPRASHTAASVAAQPVAVETPVIVTSDNASLPEGCRPRPVAEAVIRFVDAFNRGDRTMLSRIFFVSEGPSPPDFSQAGYYPWSWYSASEIATDGRVSHNFTTSNQGTLLRYFAKRHARGERMLLLKVSLTQTGLLDEENNVGFLFALTRNAQDLAPGTGGRARIAYGKGAINCRNGQIFVWSMEMRASEDRTAREAASWLCKDPPGWKPGRSVVACT